MYRPTVRYDDRFAEYVQELKECTSLDGNQIMRLALFLLGHTKEGKDVLAFYSSSPLPVPNWSINDAVLWYGKESNFKFAEGETLTPKGVTSNVNHHENRLPGPEGTAARCNDGEVCRETTKKKIRYIARVGYGSTNIVYEG
jgi:hypothetical protein